MKSAKKSEKVSPGKSSGNKKQRSIKYKFVSSTIALFLVVGIIISSISAYAIYSSTFTSLEKSMTAAVSLASTGISKQIEIFDSILVEIAANETIVSRTESEHTKAQYLTERAKDYQQYGAAFYIADTKGNVYNSDRTVSGKDFYKAAIAGEKFLSSPELRDDNGELGMVYAIPLRNVFGRIGVIFMEVNYNALYDVLASASMGETGSAYALNSTGDTILHRNQDLVLTKSNTSNDVLTDPALQPLADLEQRAMAGENGFGFYSYGGVNKFAAFAPIDGTAGWSVLVAAERDEFMSGLYSGILMCVISMIVCVIAAVLIMTNLTVKITKPIDKCVDRLEKLAEGDLTSEMPQINTNDETKILADSTGAIVKTVHFIINDMGRMLKLIGDGDFTVKSENTAMYVGDFDLLIAAMRQIISTLSDTLNQINEASDQVASGSDQVSSGAQQLSQGATEQASSIEELAATINEISSHIENTSRNAIAARDQTAQAGSEMAICNGDMKQMVAAMDEIEQKSAEIGRIIKTIEDIAFQTNILALNAAVEAARAGEAGKGFAVVADEVRNLASKSAEASKGTAELIAGAASAVTKGRAIVDETAETLVRAANAAQEVAMSVDKIAADSTEQANSILHVTTGVDQISSVVQTNSATAEESAAASEELSGQAQTLKSLVSKFNLPNTDIDYAKALSKPTAAVSRIPASGSSGKY